MFVIIANRSNVPALFNRVSIRLFRLFLCVFLVALPAISAPPVLQVDTAQVQMQLPSLDSQDDVAALQSQIQTLDKGLAIHKAISDNRLDAQDRRIGDLDVWTGQQANHMAAISNVTTWVGIAITLIALVAGFTIYFSVKDRASVEA